MVNDKFHHHLFGSKSPLIGYCHTKHTHCHHWTHQNTGKASQPLRNTILFKKQVSWNIRICCVFFFFFFFFCSFFLGWSHHTLFLCVFLAADDLQWCHHKAAVCPPPKVAVVSLVAVVSSNDGFHFHSFLHEHVILRQPRHINNVHISLRVHVIQ